MTDTGSHTEADAGRYAQATVEPGDDVDPPDWKDVARRGPVNDDDPWPRPPGKWRPDAFMYG